MLLSSVTQPAKPKSYDVRSTNPPSSKLSTLAFTLLGMSVAKSCIIPVSFWLSRRLDPTYASAECLLQLGEPMNSALEQ